MAKRSRPPPPPKPYDHQNVVAPGDSISDIQKQPGRRKRGTDTQCYGYRIRLHGRPPLEYYEANLVPQFNPTWADPGLIDQLPTSLVWPDRDLDTLRTAINAFYTMDAVTLASIKSARPHLTFGFEDFLGWLQHRIQLASSGGKSLVLVPSGDSDVAKRDVLLIKQITSRVTMEIHIVRTKLGDSWGQAIFRSGNSLLSKAWIDLVTGVPTIFREYPGRWLAAKSCPGLVTKILGKCQRAYQSTDATVRARLTQSLLVAL